MREEEI